MNRLPNRILPQIFESQFGFMSDKGTRNAVFALEMLVEKALEV